MKRRVCIRQGAALITTLWETKEGNSEASSFRCVEASIHPQEAELRGGIYIARVKNVVKSIQAAFLDIGGKLCYYSLSENPTPIYTYAVNGKHLVQNDEILVQVTKDAVKTKEPTVEAVLTFSGRYAVLQWNRSGLSVSSKISDPVWKREMKARLREYLQSSPQKSTWEHMAKQSRSIPRQTKPSISKQTEQTKQTKQAEQNDQAAEIPFAVIVRTNGFFAGKEAVLQEVGELLEQAIHTIKSAGGKTAGTCLLSGEKAYLQKIRDTYTKDLEQIITDDEGVYQELLKLFGREQNQIRLYQDSSYPLTKLYPIERVYDRTLNEKVWMKSGAYLVIQQTEALTAVDVNSGKAIAHKGDPEDTFFRINQEAGRELMELLRLRNLSGMILADFINMKSQEHAEALMELLRREAKKDPIKTVVVDMTKLGLVEITRQRLGPSFAESYSRYCRAADLRRRSD